MDKLPPITADREVSLPSLYPSDGTPLVQMMPSLTNAGPSSTASPPFKSGFQANRTTASAKEPKFVPYEPYKAAVTSILPPTKHKKTRLAKVERICPKEHNILFQKAQMTSNNMVHLIRNYLLA